MQKIDRTMTPVREIAGSAPDMTTRYLFTAPYYDFVRYRLTPDDFRVLSERSGLAIDKVRQEVAWSFIVAHPLRYASDVLMNLFAVWTLADLQSPARMAAFNSFVDAHRPVPIFGDDFYRPADRHAALVYPVKAVLGIALLVSLFAIAYGVHRIVNMDPLSPVPFFALHVAGLLHAYFLLIALVQVGIPRYSLTMWPAILALLAVCVAWSVQKLCRDGQDERGS